MYGNTNNACTIPQLGYKERVWDKGGVLTRLAAHMKLTLHTLLLVRCGCCGRNGEQW